MQDDLELRRKRLKYRSSYRGTKELDLIFGRFAARYVDAFTPEQLDAYEAIVGSDEVDLYAWIAGRQAVPGELDGEVMQLLLHFKVSEH